MMTAGDDALNRELQALRAAVEDLRKRVAALEKGTVKDWGPIG